MYYIQVNIGRSVEGSGPLTDSEWQDFQQDVIAAINGFQLYLDHRAPAITYEVHTGGGVWLDHSEESAHISAMVSPPKGRVMSGPDVATAFTHLNCDLRILAERYHQQAIALITGSKLLKPRKEVRA